MPVAPKQFYQQTYTTDDLARLFKEFAILPEHQALTARFLEDAAAIWRWRNAASEDRVTPAAARKALGEVTKHTERLRNALAALPGEAQTALARAQADAENAQLDAIETGQLAPGAASLIVPTDTGENLMVNLDAAEFQRLLMDLEALAETAAQGSPGHRGRRRDEGLRLWVANMELLWSKMLGRPFRRDTTPEGAPISEAALFCVEAARKVSPDTPASRVLNEMKKRIRDNRRNTTGRISTKKRA